MVNKKSTHCFKLIAVSKLNVRRTAVFRNKSFIDLEPAPGPRVRKNCCIFHERCDTALWPLRCLTTVRKQQPQLIMSMAAEQKSIPFTVRHLPGDKLFPSPLNDCSSFYDEQFLTIDHSVHKSLTFIKEDLPIVVEKAGPRKTLYFDPPKTTVAITTAGGLSPVSNISSTYRDK